MRLQWSREEIGCSSSSWHVNREAAAWKKQTVKKSQSTWSINIVKTPIVQLIVDWNVWIGLCRSESATVCLGVQSSLLFLIWQLFYSLSEAIFTGGRYISAARRRLVFRDAATLPEITTKSLSWPNQTINVWDCCWNRVTFPVSCLSLRSYSSPSLGLFHLLI